MSQYTPACRFAALLFPVHTCSLNVMTSSTSSIDCRITPQRSAFVQPTFTWGVASPAGLPVRKAGKSGPSGNCLRCCRLGTEVEAHEWLALRSCSCSALASLELTWLCKGGASSIRGAPGSVSCFARVLKCLHKWILTGLTGSSLPKRPLRTRWGRNIGVRC